MVALNDISLPEIKTKNVAEIIQKFELKSALIVVASDNENLMKSARNIKNVKVLKVDGINVYDILKFDTLIMTEESISKAQEALSH